jgi:hypothetical protein
MMESFWWFALKALKGDATNEKHEPLLRLSEKCPEKRNSNEVGDAYGHREFNLKLFALIHIGVGAKALCRLCEETDLAAPTMAD